jgi:hypothetical protein
MTEIRIIQSTLWDNDLESTMIFSINEAGFGE